MSASTPVLLAAAAGVGFAHAVLPDHWLPLATIGRTRRYPLSRVARLSGLAGVGHVMLSVALGAIIVAVGLQFRHQVQSAQDVIIGGLLVVTGAAFLVLQVRGHDHAHHHEHEHEEPDAPGDRDEQRSGVLGLMVPFGAAASPDLTILPVFLAATTAGTLTAIGTVVLFGVVTIATFVALTVVVAAGSYQVRAEWLEHWGNAVTGGVLVVIGALVCLHVL